MARPSPGSSCRAGNTPFIASSGANPTTAFPLPIHQERDPRHEQARPGAEVFSLDRPETLADWLKAEPLWLPLVNGQSHPLLAAPGNAARTAAIPAVDERGLGPA